MLYKLRILDVATAVVRVESVEASSPGDVASRYPRKGEILLSAQPVTTVRSQRRVPLDVAWWCRELRTLLSAGMTVVEAIETLNAQALGKARAEVHAVLIEQLRQGKPLSAAMQVSGHFPGVLIASVKASERTSTMVEALDDYLRYSDVLERLRKQVVSAAIYPAVVVSLGGLIALFLLLFVMPRFSRMYADLHGPTSMATRALIAISTTLSRHGAVIAVAITVLAIGLVFAWQTGAIARIAGTAARHISPLQSRLDEFRRAKLYQSLALMFRGGYALNDALNQCASLDLGARMSGGVASAQQALARGQRVSVAFAEAGLTDAVSQRLLAVGERTGNFDRVLQTIAERHAANFTTFIERATRIVEPLLLLIVALAVGSIVVMMYMPVFDIASSVR